MSLPTGAYAIKNIVTNTFLTVGQFRLQTQNAPIVGLPGPPHVYGWWLVNSIGNNNYQIPWVQFGILQPSRPPTGDMPYPHGQPINLATKNTTGLLSWTIEPAQNGLFTINGSGVFLQMWNEGIDQYSPVNLLSDLFGK